MTLQNNRFVQFKRNPAAIRFETAAEFTPKEGEPNANRVTRQQVESLQSIFEQVSFQLEENELRRQQMLTEVQTVAVELAVAIASKLMFSSEGASGKETAEAFAKQLMNNVDPTRQNSIWLHPSDLKVVEELVLENAELQNDKIEFRSDPSLQPGDCRIQTGGNEFVSLVQTKLVELRQQLLESLTDVETERRQNENQHRGIRRFPERRATG